MLLSQPFPTTSNPAAPEPSSLLAPAIRQPPLPTNTGWLNFILKEGSAPEYIHPYLVQCKDGALSISYPSRVVDANFIYQAFVPDLTIRSNSLDGGKHVVSSFDDLSVTVEFPGGMVVPLVRGCPYITLIFDEAASLQLSTIHAVIEVSTFESSTKHKVTFNNGQTWLIYSSDAVNISSNLVVNQDFKGVVRVALLTGNEATEEVLDSFSSAYPLQGHADISCPFEIKYKWKKGGWGELLMLSLPLHRELMSYPSPDNVQTAVTYRSMDGDMHAVIGDSWTLNEIPICVGWYSTKGLTDQCCRDIIASALKNDVAALTKITTDSSYFYGKAVARAARLALIAEEISTFDDIGDILNFLVDTITPWLEGTFGANAFLYDEKWGGLTTQNGSVNSGADFGFGVYNDHHYHLGYFCYAGAVLAKLDPTWGMKYRSHLYTLVNDYMTPYHPHIQYSKHLSYMQRDPFHPRGTEVAYSKAFFPRYRNFDFWVLHSWAGGLTEFLDGRNQESTSEAVNAYYSASLLGQAFGDDQLMDTGLTLAAFEMHSARHCGMFHQIA
ncbi:hypothetical protein KP509_08G034200 [Ceratopteris richardii]|nr:hypothetical protein KP509_08G034200 [Ceratopteris richardii]KAH7431172.1 hypothetical protein KP509_08G034200 [Ceratopteris richardii]KAH7431174.1 hypothetical protein KP509_08G034200 [Ceratopteris richardii]KAH7431175.1 hypothetical protein KP509_08G034200 [Ceratopteris richardii]